MRGIRYNNMGAQSHAKGGADNRMTRKPAGEKQLDRQNKYIAEKYDRFTVTFPKGKKEEYKIHAESKGKKLNTLINELLENDLNESK